MALNMSLTVETPGKNGVLDNTSSSSNASVVPGETIKSTPKSLALFI